MWSSFGPPCTLTKVARRLCAFGAHKRHSIQLRLYQAQSFTQTDARTILVHLNNCRLAYSTNSRSTPFIPPIIVNAGTPLTKPTSETFSFSNVFCSLVVLVLFSSLLFLCWCSVIAHPGVGPVVHGPTPKPLKNFTVVATDVIFSRSWYLLVTSHATFRKKTKTNNLTK